MTTRKQKQKKQATTMLECLLFVVVEQQPAQITP